MYSDHVPGSEPTPLPPTPEGDPARGEDSGESTHPSRSSAGAAEDKPASSPVPMGGASTPDTLSYWRQEEQRLRQEVGALQATSITLQNQLSDAQTAMGQVVREGLAELEQRKQSLQIAVEQLERRQERIKAEMRTSFAGVSQDLAIRVQGFKDYLVGSLQDLAVAAEQLEITPRVAPARPAPAEPRPAPPPDMSSAAGFAPSSFQDEAKQIRRLLDQYRLAPDYYGPPWQLRRTFEPIHADRVGSWFFNQGGRGAIRTMGSRLQNILVVSAAISILRHLHGDRLRTLVLAESPERLGEWRRGLQDCLGVSRNDFGANEGIVLFETPEPLAQRADRLVKQKFLPLIIIDEADDDRISLSLLQFPLWLAIAADPMNPSMTY